MKLIRASKEMIPMLSEFAGDVFIDYYKDLIGKNLFECHRPESKAAILALVEDMKNGGEARRIGTSKIEGYRIYMIPVRDKDGNMIGYIDQFEHP